MPKIKQSGYTMIEILVVMSIIAFITVAAWYYIDYSRKLARDTKRVADLSQIQKALETFRNQYGRYPGVNAPACTTQNDPDCTPTYTINGNGECIGDQDSAGNPRGGSITECGNSKKFEVVMKDFMANIPADPLHNCSTNDCNATDYFYSYDPTHTCPGGGSGCTTLCFNVSEMNKTCSTFQGSVCVGGGTNMQQNSANYCIALK